MSVTTLNIYDPDTYKTFLLIQKLKYKEWHQADM